MSEKLEGKALKAGVWYTVANFMGKGMGFLTMPIFNRLLSTSEVGDYSNFSSYLTILTSVLTLDLFTSVTLAKFDLKEEHNKFISSILILGTLWTCVAYLVASFFKESIKSLIGFSELEFHLLFIICLVSPAIGIFQMKNRIEFKYKLSTALSLSSTVACTLVSLICTLTFKDRLTGRIVGLYFPAFLLNIGIYLYFLLTSFSVDIKYWKYALPISLPLIFNVLSGHILTLSDRVMINGICGKEELGLYSVAYSCASIAITLLNATISAWQPWALTKMDQGNIDQLKKATKYYLGFYAVIVTGYLLVAPDILWLMGDEPYMEAKYVMPPIMVGVGFQCAYSLYADVETYCKKQKLLAAATVIASISNICLNYFLLPRIGYLAAAYTTLAGYVILFIINFFFVRRIGKINWVNNRFVLLYIAMLGGILLLANVVYSLSVLRYILVGLLFIAFVCFLIAFRKEIRLAVKGKTVNPLLESVKNRFHIAV